MPRQCTVCIHQQREEIDRALVDNEPFRHIAARYRVSTGALQRHKADHLPATLAKAKEAKEVSQADDLLQEVRTLWVKAYNLLLAAEEKKDFRTALAGVREARSCLELLAKLIGELDERPQVNILVMPQWIETRTALLNALRPFPEARVAVADALTQLEGSNGHSV